MSDDRAQLRARFTVPADRDLPPGRHLLHRENLMNQILHESPSTNPSPRRSSAWHRQARGLIATAAAVAVVAGLGVTAAARLSGHQAAPDATATAVLDRAAQTASAMPACPVAPDQYFYDKIEFKATDAVGQQLGPLIMQRWHAQGSSRATERFRGQGVIEGGTSIGLDEVLPLANGGVKNPDTWPSYAYLQSLPTDPRHLLSFLKEETPDHTADEEFMLISEYLWLVLPPRTASALYQAAALIPGITVVPDVTDALGRHGIGITVTDGFTTPSAKNTVTSKTTWIFDKSSYQFLGMRWSMTENSKLFQAGTSALLAKGVADSLGGTPTLVRQHR